MKTEEQIRSRIDMLHKLIFTNKVKTKEEEQKMLKISAVMRELESVLEDGAEWKKY